MHFGGPRARDVLIYLGAAAVLALTSGNVFSDPGQHPVASHHSKAGKADTSKRSAATDATHRSKTVKAEGHKHRPGTDAPHGNKIAKGDKRKHSSPADAKHSERAPGTRARAAQRVARVGPVRGPIGVRVWSDDGGVATLVTGAT